MVELTERQTQYCPMISGHRMCYAEFGAEGGTPLLYFHGWPSSRLQAHSLDQLGKELGITVYAPDRPGLGQSDHYEGRVLKDWPTMVAQFLDYLGHERAYLMGVSGGGPYALATACALNERIISTSIVCGAPPLAEIEDRSEMIWPYRALLQARPIIPALMKPVIPLTKWIASKTYDEPPLSWFVQTLSSKDQEILKGDEANLFALYSFREALANGAPGLIIDADAYTNRWDLDYNEISHPVHFWHGTADQNIPFKMAQHLAAQVPNAVPHWLEGEGHYTVPIQHSREILAHMVASV